MTNHSVLFEPVTLGALELKNRIVMAPMTRNMSPDNIPGDQVVDYYRRRAEGGAGLILTEGTCINHSGANGYHDVPYFYGEERLNAWQKVADAVHAAGGKIAPQLWHCGGMRKAGTAPEVDAPSFTPSGMNVPGKVNRYEMTKTDIHEVIAAFAQGARDAERLGFDAVELHGAHGYIIDQFFWEGTNQRTDEYGGSPEKRLRFALDIIAAVREQVSKEFPVLLRWSQWKSQDFTARLADSPQALEKFLLPLSEAGVDAFHCSQRRFWEPEFDNSELNLAGWTRKITGKPAITVGSVGLNADFVPLPGEASFRDAEPASLERLIERLDAKEFDLVAVGRAMIANPDWTSKVQSGDVDSLKPYRKELLEQLQ